MSPLPRTMTSKVCSKCQRTIFVNENGSLYQDVGRSLYHTEERCTAIRLETRTLQLEIALRALHLIANAVPDAPHPRDMATEAIRDALRAKAK